MRLLLISPTHYLRDGSLLKTTQYWTSGLTLPTLKALTPAGWEVRLLEELLEPGEIDWPADVVGITAMGPQIVRAYELADLYRARGSKVVLGGAWVSLAPAEASLAHADAIVTGEAEAVWRECLEDLAAGRSKGVYRAERWVEPDEIPSVDLHDLQIVDWSRFRRSPFYRSYFHWPLIFSRGCPLPCSYCAVQTFYKRSYRTRSVERVLDDVRRIKAIGGRNLLFLDDNPIGDPEAAKELFRALLPEGIRWTSQCTIEIARDPELLDLAARSGCVSLSIGLESIDAYVLKRIRKGFNRPDRYAEDLRALRARGIQVIALVMLGLDGQDAGVFDRTVSFLRANKVSLVKFFTPAPYPGTDFHERMVASGRLKDQDWSHYDYGSLLVEPTGMSPDQLRDGFDEAYRRFYSLGSIANRMLPPPPRNWGRHAGYVVANLKSHLFLRRNPVAWGTIS
ncbi:MAG: B12-binding domain-containing radical SAM protein [Deltaproteobacteria bacterium]|nr:B12-binding domain-containing radical SAM protein [Deltaproteobacteria bacterium]